MDSEDSDKTGWMLMQADLSIRWAHMQFCWFCHKAAHLAMMGSLRQNFILGWDKQAETKKSLILVPCVRMVYHR